MAKQVSEVREGWSEKLARPRKRVSVLMICFTLRGEGGSGGCKKCLSIGKRDQAGKEKDIEKSKPEAEMT